MRKLTIILTILSIFSLSPILAQLREFDLSKYKLPDIIRHQLDLNANLDGRITDDDYSSESKQFNSYSGMGNANIRYYFYRNSKKYQGNQSASFSSSYSNSSRDEKIDLSSSNSHKQDYLRTANSLRLYSSNRFYFKGLNFIELELYSRVSNEARNSERKEYQGVDNSTIFNSKDENSYRRYDIELPVSYGYGRIERVEDARQAIYILSDLKRIGNLKRTPDDQEIIALAEKISDVKNQRFFDSRLQLIKELETVDTFLKNADLIEDSDIAYFTSVNDMWNYGALQTRLAGYRINGGIIPYYTQMSNHKIDESTDYSQGGDPLLDSEDITLEKHISRLMLNIGFEYEKPIKQKWQYSLHSFFRVGPYQSNYKSTDNNDNSFNSESNLKTTDYIMMVETGFGFYPNTRTYLSLNISGLGYYDEGTYTSNDAELESKSKYYQLDSYFQAYYYISPKRRLSGQYKFGYENLDGNNYDTDKYDTWRFFAYNSLNNRVTEGENKYKKNNHTFTIALTYSIF